MKQSATTKSSEPGKVDSYIKQLRHPLRDVVEVLRQIILQTSKKIGEEIKWNAPAYFYTGDLEPSNPREYARYLVVFNLFRKDCVRLVFWHGDKANDTTGFLEGEYADGRRLATFSSIKDVQSRKKQLQTVLKAQIRQLES